MRLITEKSKNEIGKKLSAIYCIAIHGFGNDYASDLICVQCNKCGRFCEGCVRPKESFCSICSHNPEIEDQYVSGDAERGEEQ